MLSSTNTLPAFLHSADALAQLDSDAPLLLATVQPGCSFLLLEGGLPHHCWSIRVGLHTTSSMGSGPWWKHTFMEGARCVCVWGGGIFADFLSSTKGHLSIKLYFQPIPMGSKSSEWDSRLSSLTEAASMQGHKRPTYRATRRELVLHLLRRGAAC